MLCSRATRSSRFRESFISLQNVGKPYLKRTKRIFAIQKTSRSVRHWSFLKHISLRTSLEGPRACYAPVRALFRFTALNRFRSTRVARELARPLPAQDQLQ